jgi:hypothetical protein
MDSTCGVTPKLAQFFGHSFRFLAWQAVTRVTGSSILLTDYRVRAVRRRNGEKAQILPVPIVTSFRRHYIGDRVASRQLNFLAKGREACSDVRRSLR